MKMEIKIPGTFFPEFIEKSLKMKGFHLQDYFPQDLLDLLDLLGAKFSKTFLEIFSAVCRKHNNHPLNVKR